MSTPSSWTGSELIVDNSFLSLRRRALKVFSLVRLAFAALLLAYGPIGEFGFENRGLFHILAPFYCLLSLAIVLVNTDRFKSLDSWLTLQVIADLAILLTFLSISGGSRSTVSVLIMALIAAASLISAGRLSFFFASLASVGLLIEQSLRYLKEGQGSDFAAAGGISIGFFVVSAVFRLLSTRLLDTEHQAQDSKLKYELQRMMNEQIVHDMQDGVILVDAESKVLLASPQAADLLGFKLSAGDELQKILPSMTSLPSDGERIFIKSLGRDLRLRFVRHSSKDSQVLIYVQDFNDLQKQFQQIRLASLGRLVAGMAHEIRNPLAAMSHASELLREEHGDELHQRLTRIINDNCSRIARLVTEVLSLGKSDKSRRTQISLKNTVVNIFDEMLLREPLSNTIISFFAVQDFSINFDLWHFNQIVNNLLNNSIRHCSKKPGSVKVSIVLEENDCVTLSVHDDGEGILAENYGRLFEPFFTTAAQGTGLGLYIAKELANANEAELLLRPSDVGANFVLLMSGKVIT